MELTPWKALYNLVSMKKKFLNALIFLFFSFLAIACKDGERKAEGNAIAVAESTTVEGDMKPYFEIIEKEYAVQIFEESINENGAEISVEFKRTATDFPDAYSMSPISASIGMDGEIYAVLFTLEILDANGNVISEKISESPYTVQGVIDVLGLEKGGTGHIPWTLDKDQVERFTTFRISTSLNLIPYIDAAEKEQIKKNRDSANSGSGSNDWDIVIDDFEANVAEYLRMFENIQKNDDEDNLETFVAVQNKGTELTKRLNKAQENGLLSDAQIERMFQIQEQFIKKQTEILNKAILN